MNVGYTDAGIDIDIGAYINTNVLFCSTCVTHNISPLPPPPTDTSRGIIHLLCWWMLRIDIEQIIVII